MRFRKSGKQLTVRFLHRTILFFSVFTLVLWLFFIFGNFQLFKNETLTALLHLIRLCGTATTILSTVVIVVELILFFMQRRRLYLMMVGVSLLCGILGLIHAVISSTIILLSNGLTYSI